MSALGAADSNRSPLLSARGLRKSFGRKQAVDGLDITVDAGECLAMLGPNGAGKTTTVEMLEGLLAPDAGSIEIFGLPLATERRTILERVGILLQDTQLYKRYTVRETVQLFGSFYRNARSPDALIAELGLTEKASAQLRTLSGGQKQRVAIATALVNDPELMFLDEPTTGLDPQARRAIWDLLAAVKARGKGILLTTHYMEEAAVLADRVAIIDHGRIIALGKPADLVRAHCGAQRLWVELAELDAGSHAPAGDQTLYQQKLTEHAPWIAEAHLEGEGLAISSRDVAALASQLFAAAAKVRLAVRQLRVRDSTLEDVFLALTGRSFRDV